MRAGFVALLLAGWLACLPTVWPVCCGCLIGGEDGLRSCGHPCELKNGVNCVCCGTALAVGCLDTLLQAVQLIVLVWL
jgi:hypothetical protein